MFPASTAPTDHQICEQARQVACVCGAAPGQPCGIVPAGVHMARVSRARAHGLLGHADVSWVIHQAGVHNEFTVVPDDRTAGAA